MTIEEIMRAVAEKQVATQKLKRLEKELAATKTTNLRTTALWGLTVLGAFVMGAGISANPSITPPYQPANYTTSGHITNHTAATDNSSIAVTGGQVTVNRGFDLYEIIEDPVYSDIPMPLPNEYDKAI